MKRKIVCCGLDCYFVNYANKILYFLFYMCNSVNYHTTSYEQAKYICNRNNWEEIE
jgi:hypothetical protein